jgi:phthiodiolone/phenolphthiodiolone dimycocerosates ketoreductase
MRPVKFGLVAGGYLNEALEYGVNAEKWGFDLVTAYDDLFFWTPEVAYNSWEPFTLLTLIMSRTKRVKLMTCVIDSVRRHPSAVAQIVSTVDNVSRGRLSIGIGAGEIANFGPLLDLVDKPLRLCSRLREFLTVLYGLWDSTIENPFNFNGEYFRVRNAFYDLKPLTKPHPPVYVAALGPNMRKLVGEMADGWLPLTYTPETYADHWKEIQRAAKSAGRSDQVLPALKQHTVVLKDGDKAREEASIRGKVNLSVRPDLLHALGLHDLAEKVEAFSIDRIPTSPLVQSVKTKLLQTIPDDLATKASICGTPDDAIEQIEAFIKAGVRLLVVHPNYEISAGRKTVNETIENYRRTILPYFAKLNR